MMLKFDPDDAEDDEDGPKPSSAASGAEAGAQASGVPGGVQYHEGQGVVPPITLTINAGHSDNSPDKVRINNVQTVVRNHIVFLVTYCMYDILISHISFYCRMGHLREYQS